MLYLGNGGHGDSLTRLFGSHKGFYDGQWPLTGVDLSPFIIAEFEQINVSFRQ